MSSNGNSLLSFSEGSAAPMDSPTDSRPSRGIRFETAVHRRDSGSQCSSASIRNPRSDTSPDHRMSLSGSVMLDTAPNDPRKYQPKVYPRPAIEKRRKSKSSSSDSSSSEDSEMACKRALLFNGEKESSGDDESTDFAIRKKAFILSLMDSSPVHGYLNCKLCGKDLWGPNGRYHIEKCEKIRRFRAMETDEMKLQFINGLRIHSEFFAKPKPLRPKQAKIEGFVMSNSVLLSDARVAPTRAELKAGAVVGRKGYTRCLACNAELFAPNTKRHACSRRESRSGGV